MRIWMLSDLHLSLASDKPMDVFGEHWRDHHLRIAEHWDDLVAAEDLVLSPGDFSWAGKPEEAGTDFQWLGQRPGHKVLIKGNHDYWWPRSKSKLAALLPPQTYALKKTACRIGGVGLFGARGGDFAPLTRYGDQRSQEDVDRSLEKEERELRLSLEHLERLEATGEGEGPGRGLRICLFHYPPLPPGAKRSRFTPWIESSGARFCIYGHLHGSEVASARVEGEHGGGE
jgi:predicted phosphohydrolase